MKNKELLVALALWLSAGFIGNYINARRNQEVYLSKPIPCYASQEELLKDAEIEKRKLGLEEVAIKLNEDPCMIENVTTRQRNGFRITFNSQQKNRLVLRHELFHINQWGKVNLVDFLTMGNYNEYRATSYSIANENK